MRRKAASLLLVAMMMSVAVPVHASEQATVTIQESQGENREVDQVQSSETCLLYTSDAADDSLRVDLGGRRIIKKKFFQAEDGIRDRSPSRGLGDVYKRQRPHAGRIRLIALARIQCRRKFFPMHQIL